MPTLTPTVHERLARCGTRVHVDGLVTGANVVLSIDGAEFAVLASGGGHTFDVPPLAARAVVRAKQDAGDGFSPWSPEIIVEDAAVPPESAPRLPEQVGCCSHCVLVEGLVPGCEVELSVGGVSVGHRTANRHGDACVAVDLTKGRVKVGVTLNAQMIVCGAPGPMGSAPIVAEPALPKPGVGSPLFGCQRIVPLSNLHRGAMGRLETDTGTNLGSFCSCWTAVNVRVGQNLVVGERVRARQYWDGGRACRAEGPWSDWQLVVPPDERITPRVREPLIEGDEFIRVENQILGADLIIRIRPSAGEAPEEFGPRPAGTEQEIAVNEPLAAGNVVSVVQTLCAVSMESDPVTVQPRPPEILAPVIVPPLYECGAAVQVSRLHPGALVRIYQNGIPIGVMWAAESSSISVPANPGLVRDREVTAIQEVGGVESPPSSPVTVRRLRNVQPPRILAPVALGDTQVWVSRVTPGARVSIWSDGQLLGEADAAEPIVRIPIQPVSGPVSARARLCGRTADGPQVEGITTPCAGGRFTKTGERFASYGAWTVPETPDGDSFETRIEGQLYYPGSGERIRRDARNMPLVIIAHGLWPYTEYYDEVSGEFLPVNSYKGYDYLARHLARWGMLVFSLNMDDVNDKTSGRPHQYSRGKIILRAISALLGDSSLQGRINPDRLGLIGHSMGGEGVVMAQHLNYSEGHGYAIRGVVSIAPTHWRPEVTLRGTKYMQLLGSMDQLVSVLENVTGGGAPFSGFRIYDRAWRPKTHFWIYGARHNPFNRRWVASGDLAERYIADIALPPQDHERIAKCLINAFFQDALFDQIAYAGYMEGTILPRSLLNLEIHTQHSREPRVVVDNHGDADDQAGLVDLPLDKRSNSLAEAVDAAGGGLGIWEDVSHIDLAHSPHQTKGVELSWSRPEADYESQIGNRAAALTDSLAVRLSQFFEDAPLNPVGEPVDLLVTVTDTVGRDAAVRLGAVAQIPYPDAYGDILSVLRTVRLPFDAFKAANPAINLNHIASVKLRLIGRATGHILADDFELSR